MKSQDQEGYLPTFEEWINACKEDLKERKIKKSA